MLYILPDIGLFDETVDYDIHIEIKDPASDMYYHKTALCRHVLGCIFTPAEHVVLDMEYYSGEMLSPSDQVVVKSTCRPRLVIYVAVFGIFPLLIVTMVAVVFIYRRQRARNSFFNRFSYSHNLGISGGNSLLMPASAYGTFKHSPFSSVSATPSLPPWHEITGNSLYNV